MARVVGLFWGFLRGVRSGCCGFIRVRICVVCLSAYGCAFHTREHSITIGLILTLKLLSYQNLLPPLTDILNFFQTWSQGWC